MRTPIVFFSVLLGLSTLRGHAQSSTVNYTGGPGQRDVFLDPSTPVPDGNQVKVGYFTSGFDVLGNSVNIPALFGAWHELDVTPIATIFGQPGRFADTISTSDSQFAGQRICLWIFKTTDNSAPNLIQGNITAYGLYSSTAGNWSFPAWGAVPPANTASINSSEVDQAFYGAFDPAHLFLSSVPEPSTRSLLALGAVTSTLFFLRFPRRQSKAMPSRAALG